MRKIALIYGSLSGLIIIGVMIIGYLVSDGEGALSSQALGFFIMFVALSLIFFGIKRYRDQELGGVIRFGRAFGMGLAIAGVASVFYIIGWEIYLAATDFAFIETYTAQILEKEAAAGVEGAEYAALVEKMEAKKADYARPLYRIPITFTEVFPVAALIALISAAFLRKK